MAVVRGRWGRDQVEGVWGEPRRQGVRGTERNLKLMGTEMCRVRQTVTAVFVWAAGQE